jgi:hypothetical protein
MKFSVPVPCSSCGCDFAALGYGELTFPPATCPRCGVSIHILDPLTFDVVASRLLYRADAELKSGAFTMPIIFGAMALESALTSLFLKWRKLESGYPTEASDVDREEWEAEYRANTSPGGFSKAANFVSKFLNGKSFDGFVKDFLERSSKAAIIKADLPMFESQTKADYIQIELFRRRNRIMHWGEVGYKKADAAEALAAGRTAFAILTVMDKARADALDQKIRESQIPVAEASGQ